MQKHVRQIYVNCYIINFNNIKIQLFISIIHGFENISDVKENVAVTAGVIPFSKQSGRR